MDVAVCGALLPEVHKAFCKSWHPLCRAAEPSRTANAAAPAAAEVEQGLDLSARNPNLCFHADAAWCPQR